MDIYLAARYARHPELQGYAWDLIRRGHRITARWVWGGHDVRANGEQNEAAWQPIWAAEDWEDLMAAELVISFTEPPGPVAGRARGGRHVEFGAALAAGKLVVVVGPPENVFHYLPGVQQYATWPDFLAAPGLVGAPVPP